MSEYQYYEFQAVDRPLTQAEMAELRALTTRATITPTRLQNVYHWGDFKGDPLALMERCFDAFVYVANWGTHRFMVRLPRRIFDPTVTRPYVVERWLEVTTRGDVVILDLTADSEEGGDWVMDEEAEGWMPALLPLRDDLANGDLRALSIAWLAAALAGVLDDEETEPPVPPGLGTLSASLSALAEFLYVDQDLLAVAAACSAELPKPPPATDVQRWVAALPVQEKDAWLVRLAEGETTQLRAEILQRFRRANAAPLQPAAGRRTVAELLSAAEERAEARRREEAAREAAERARLEREQAATRSRYLDGLAGREDELWRQAEALIERTQPKAYDEAVELLRDLHDLSARGQQTEVFAARLAALRQRNARRPSLLERLDRARLGAVSSG
jgi:hypothetical protein